MALCHEPWGPPCGQGRPRTTRSKGRVDDRAGREMKSRKGSTAFGSPVRSGPERMVRALHINLVEARTLRMAPHGLTWPPASDLQGVFLRHGSSHPVGSVLFKVMPTGNRPKAGSPLGFTGFRRPAGPWGAGSEVGDGQNCLGVSIINGPKDGLALPSSCLTVFTLYKAEKQCQALLRKGPARAKTASANDSA